MTLTGRLLSLEPRKGLDDGCRSEVASARDPKDLHPRAMHVACEQRVFARLRARVELRLAVEASVRDGCDRKPDVVQAEEVAGLFEDGASLDRERFEPIDDCLRVDEQTDRGLLETGAQHCARVARCRRAVGQRAHEAVDLAGPSAREQGVGEIVLEVHVVRARRQEGDGALEQARRGRVPA